MSVHVHLAPKMRIDAAEERIVVIERQMNVLRHDNQRLRERVITLENTIDLLQNRDNTIANVVGRLAQRMEA